MKRTCDRLVPLEPGENPDRVIEIRQRGQWRRMRKCGEEAVTVVRPRKRPAWHACRVHQP